MYLTTHRDKRLGLSLFILVLLCGVFPGLGLADGSGDTTKLIATTVGGMAVKQATMAAHVETLNVEMGGVQTRVAENNETLARYDDKLDALMVGQAGISGELKGLDPSRLNEIAKGQAHVSGELKGLVKTSWLQLVTVIVGMVLASGSAVLVALKS